jgi:hypothetical protein
LRDFSIFNILANFFERRHFLCKNSIFWRKNQILENFLGHFLLCCLSNFSNTKKIIRLHHLITNIMCPIFGRSSWSPFEKKQNHLTFNEMFSLRTTLRLNFYTFFSICYHFLMTNRLVTFVSKLTFSFLNFIA